MGPGHGDDHEAELRDKGAQERVDLGERVRPSGPPDGSGQAGRPTEGDRPGEPPGPRESPGSSERGGAWLAGLVRADVLGLSGLGVVVLSVIGIPFLTALQNVTFFMGPVELSSAWAFLPFVVAGGVAALLGLGGLRQAGRHGIAWWVHTVAGVAVLLGLLLAAGSAVTWLYAAETDYFSQGSQS